MHFTVAESPKCLFISPTLLHDIAQNSEKAENFILIKQENYHFGPMSVKKRSECRKLHPNEMKKKKSTELKK